MSNVIYNYWCIIFKIVFWTKYVQWQVTIMPLTLRGIQGISATIKLPDSATQVTETQKVFKQTMKPNVP